MIRPILSLLILSLPLAADRHPAHKANPYLLREGDIVFQSNGGLQSMAVRAATGSGFTHCGVVAEIDGRLVVFEAVQPVRSTPLDEWVRRGVPGSFHARRLTRPLDRDALSKARTWATAQAGKDYDLRFAWDDNELYCSELVWKLYKQAGVELCQPRPFRDYNLEDPTVKAIIKQRYGGIHKLPLDEPAVAPGDLAQSKLLIEVPKRGAKEKG